MSNSPFPKEVENALQADRDRRNREQLEEVVKLTRRGGARPGAGRPRGSKKYENGRKNAATLCYYVPDEIKSMLAEKAERAGVTQTEFLCRLIREA
ncbi:MAG: hypothetical protein IKE69_01415 [Thermoguttaceae bacterium]|nr:hypothetical protein [Thermoguttaceae bacterium]